MGQRACRVAARRGKGRGKEGVLEGAVVGVGDATSGMWQEVGREGPSDGVEACQGALSSEFEADGAGKIAETRSPQRLSTLF